MNNKQQGLAMIITVLLVILIAAGLGVGAYFGYSWWQDRNDKKQQPSTPAPAPDPRAGWLTYTDSESGFSLRYPPDWTTKQGNPPASTHGTTIKDTAFLGPTEKVFLTVRTNPDPDLEAFVKADGVTDVKQAKVDSLEGYAAVTSDSYRVYLGKDSKVYMFTFPGAKTNTDLSDEQVNLLTSFQFITSSTSPGTTTPSDIPQTWKTYTNTKFGFTMRYPDTWGAPESYGGVNAPGNGTYKVEGADAYEYVFTFVPKRIDDFPVIITVYDLSAANATVVREKVISNLWSTIGSKKITRKDITVDGRKAVLVTVTIDDSSLPSGKNERNFVFIEKTGRLYEIEGTNVSSSDFELLYNSFTLTQ